jgi:pseudaminic acid cytidylyltransferase
MICIIPARGGSERLPNKNVLQLDGLPVIAHVIRIAKDSTMFDQIIVSTDDTSIAETALMHGADILMRSEKTSGDVSETSVLREVVSYYLSDTYCRLYPFAALLTPERIISTSQFIKAYDAVMECQVYGHPPQRAFTKAGYAHPSFVHMRTQDIEPLYHDAGTLRWFAPESLTIPLPMQRIKWCEVSEIEAQDVDTADDFEMLRAKYFWSRR